MTKEECLAKGKSEAADKAEEAETEGSSSCDREAAKAEDGNHHASPEHAKKRRHRRKSSPRRAAMHPPFVGVSSFRFTLIWPTGRLADSNWPLPPHLHLLQCHNVRPRPPVDVRGQKRGRWWWGAGDGDRVSRGFLSWGLPEGERGGL
ncbi:hypothetical protein OPV22_005363 [Ensete ventricosum]|uniref:Uncharacterized protein n=1 Tax=Ensete ventricosum TaxID=4639 RepID=A0AAV8Q138_ENSVE|nr:hypothetical protein OPV22_005363 [Ensete ventricosum]